MTREETVKIMGILGAVYGREESLARSKERAAGWYLVFRSTEYPYEDVQRGVARFMEMDSRDYPTFPSPGQIVQAVKDDKKARKGFLCRTWNNLRKAREINDVLPETRDVLGDETVNKILNIPPDKIDDYREVFIARLEGKVERGEVSRRQITGSTGES